MSEKEKGALSWKIEKIISKGDYNYVKVANHPNSTKNGYVLEHRVVMENHLGRILNPNEVVHHKNHNKKDNRIENLEVLNNGEHSRIHSLRRGKTFAEVKCPNCGKVFELEKRQTHISKGGKFTSCSARCRGSFSRKIQLMGLTVEVERAISGNIVSVYKKYAHDNPEVTEDDGNRRGHTPST